MIKQSFISKKNIVCISKTKNKNVYQLYLYKTHNYTLFINIPNLAVDWFT